MYRDYYINSLLLVRRIITYVTLELRLFVVEVVLKPFPVPVAVDPVADVGEDEASCWLAFPLPLFEYDGFFFRLFVL